MASFKIFFAFSLALSLAMPCLADESLMDKIQRMLQEETHSDPDLKRPTPKPKPLKPEPEENSEKPFMVDQDSTQKVQKALYWTAEAITGISLGTGSVLAVLVACCRCLYRWREEGVIAHLRDLSALFMAVVFRRQRPAHGVIALPAP